MLIPQELQLSLNLTLKFQEKIACCIFNIYICGSNDFTQRIIL